ncbi:MAG: hypothetical protein Q4F67_09015, partial [Propionibacteriaceae bacterium]|nr:hypothetical protein [Propionibacteriaceae bacterium]
VLSGEVALDAGPAGVLVPILLEFCGAQRLSHSGRLLSLSHVRITANGLMTQHWAKFAMEVGGFAMKKMQNLTNLKK